MSATQEDYVPPRPKYDVPNPTMFGVMSSFLTWIVLFAMTLLNFNSTLTSNAAFEFQIVVSVSYLVVGYLVYPLIVFGIVKTVRGRARGIRQFVIGTAVTTTVAALFSLAFYTVLSLTAWIAVSPP
jgi:hypothetical protein